MSLEHILICGLGSMGQRHARIFKRAGVNRIDAFRTGKATLDLEQPDLIGNSYDDLAAALNHGTGCLLTHLA